LNERKQPFGPIVLEPIFVERVWGSPKLDDWYPQPSDGKPIGEVWLTAEECGAKETGSTLAEMTAKEPEAFGDHGENGFPLLIKMLYPREKLSVQVHPNDEQAMEMLNQPRGKTECWYILSAEPGATVAVGFKEPITNEEVAASIVDGSIESKLSHVPVSAGDMVFVDAGTVHAIGPGVVVLETQQYSDVTYRLWDYGRARELHVKDGMAVTRTETSAGLVKPVDHGDFTRLISCKYFKVDRFKLRGDRPFSLGEDKNLQILVALSEGASVLASGVSHPLPPGSAVLLPAEDIAYSLQAATSVEVVRIVQ
jgi:mannose-6-phosphate isomerase